MRKHYVKPPASGLQKPGSGSTHLIINDRASIKGLTVFRVFYCHLLRKYAKLCLDGWYSERKLYLAQTNTYPGHPLFRVAFLICWGVHIERSNELKRLSRKEKDIQIRREARATLILFAICFVWNVAFAYGLSGTGARLFGLPVWWLVSTPGMFVIAVIGVVYLLKKVFVNFDLEDDEEGGALNAD